MNLLLSLLPLLTLTLTTALPLDTPSADIPVEAARVPEFFSVVRCKHENGIGCAVDNFRAEPGTCFNLAAEWNNVITGFNPGAGNYCILYHDFNCNGPSLGFNGPRWNLMDEFLGIHNDRFSSFRCWRA